jgi:3-hydroxyacyl-CoA dehydrogenase
MQALYPRAHSWFASLVHTPGERKGTPDPEVRAMIEAASAAKGIARRAFTPEAIVRRALATMVNESVLLLTRALRSGRPMSTW